ncbi:hypothetical protein LCGC14_1544470 [marine sediment metagenome]|uniref:Uncharacterized protein n=1 Tax=marine sediment metagenome TaxID=412755 RepID=A0A0F9JD15_9ZZZZ
MKVKTIKDKSKVPIWKDRWVSSVHINKDYSGDLRVLSFNRRDRNKGNPL